MIKTHKTQQYPVEALSADLQAVHIDLNGTNPDLVDGVLRLEVPAVQLPTEALSVSLRGQGFDPIDIDRVMDTLYRQVNIVQLAKLFADRM